MFMLIFQFKKRNLNLFGFRNFFMKLEKYISRVTINGK